MRRRSNAAAVAAYITWVGFLIALFIGDRTDRFTMHHMNQALVVDLVSFAGGLLVIIPVLGSTVSWIISVAVLAFNILGVIRAATWSMEPLPFIGDIHIIG